MKNYNSREWLKENGISNDSIAHKKVNGCYALPVSDVLDDYVKIAITEAIETASCHVDGEIDKEGALVNALNQFGLTI